MPSAYNDIAIPVLAQGFEGIHVGRKGNQQRALHVDLAFQIKLQVLALAPKGRVTLRLSEPSPSGQPPHLLLLTGRAVRSAEPSGHLDYRNLCRHLFELAVVPLFPKVPQLRKAGIGVDRGTNADHQSLVLQPAVVFGPAEAQLYY